jgi:hypothetical protein
VVRKDGSSRYACGPAYHFDLDLHSMVRRRVCGPDSVRQGRQHREADQQGQLGQLGEHEESLPRLRLEAAASWIGEAKKP